MLVQYPGDTFFRALDVPLSPGDYPGSAPFEVEPTRTRTPQAQAGQGAAAGTSTTSVPGARTSVLTWEKLQAAVWSHWRGETARPPHWRSSFHLLYAHGADEVVVEDEESMRIARRENVARFKVQVLSVGASASKDSITSIAGESAFLRLLV